MVLETYEARHKYDNFSSIDHTPSGAVSAGEVVVVGEMALPARLDIAANAKGALATDGVFECAKSTGTGTAITAGAKLYWNASSNVVTTTAGSNKVIGYAVAAASTSAAKVDVLLARA